MDVSPTIKVSDIVSWGLLVAGFGFGGWAYFLQKSIKMLDGLTEAFHLMVERQARLEVEHAGLRREFDRHLDHKARAPNKERFTENE
jgi:hypothetical protein